MANTASKSNFLDHARWFRAACRAAGAEAILSLDSWHAFVRTPSQHVAFHPQFQATIKGRLQYQPALTDEATMFAGWMPYRAKQWDIAVDKLAFKRYAQSVGVRVPRYWLDNKAAPTNVVVKAPRSSFGTGVAGPYRQAADRPLDLAQGEYYEEFLGGDILKIWYWNDQAVCAEVDKMSFVFGDDSSTIAQLIERLAAQWGPMADDQKALLLRRCEPLVTYWGRQLSDVLPKGARQVVEFRYGSRLVRLSQRKVLNLLQDDDPPAWLAQAEEAGTRLFQAIPQEIRAQTVFTVDAMLPADGELRFLEMNCSPAVHPLVYPLMTRDLLGTAETRMEAAH